MSEEFGDKTEAPTPRRREEAREQGNIARSPDLTSAVVLLGVMILLNWYGTSLVFAMRDLMQNALGISLTDRSPSNATHSMLDATLQIGAALAPIFVGIMLLAILINMAQVGFFFSTQRLQPNFSVLNPMRGIGKLFQGGSGFVSLLMNLLKLTLVTLVAWSAIEGRIQEIANIQQLDYLQAFGLGASMIYTIALRIGILLLILAILDYAYQKFKLERDLRMTKQEVKEEMRRMDGDPMIKQRRRQIANQMMLNRLKKDVPTADVVVTNPTEFAVALKYDAGSMHAPRVVAKGQGYVAQRIREIAVASGVPILERKPLARALFKLVEVGQEIPEQFYSAVAEILAYVYELSGKARRMQPV